MRHVAERLPLITPCSSTKSFALAIPKSAIFTEPSKDRSTFCGETSRWTISSGAPSSPLRSCA